MNPADPTSPQSLHVDAGELRRRIAVCFSATDLRTLAESLGLGHIAPWERGVNEGARELVRHFEREHALPALLEKLREARPLVEWPEPVALSTSSLAFVPGPAPSLTSPESAGSLGPPQSVGSAPDPRSHAPAQPMSSPGSLGPTQAMGSPGTFGPTQPMGSPGSLGGARPMGSPGYLGAAPPMTSPGYLGAPPPVTSPGSFSSGTQHSEGVEAAPPSGMAPASRSEGKWIPPGHEPPANEPARAGIDPRILIAVSALMVLGAGIAYIAGRATSSSGPTPVASANAGPRQRSPNYRPDGPAGRAAQVFARSFANVARACEVPLTGEPGTEVLASAYEQCGPPPPDSPRRPRQPSAGVDPPPTEPGRPPRGPARPPGGGPREANPPLPGGGSDDCISGCDGTHRTCRTGCGPEPKQSSEYSVYQACLGRCLSRASLCRRGCPN